MAHLCSPTARNVDCQQELLITIESINCVEALTALCEPEHCNIHFFLLVLFSSFIYELTDFANRFTGTAAVGADTDQLFAGLFATESCQSLGQDVARSCPLRTDTHRYSISQGNFTRSLSSFFLLSWLKKKRIYLICNVLSWHCLCRSSKTCCRSCQSCGPDWNQRPGPIKALRPINWAHWTK